MAPYRCAPAKTTLALVLLAALILTLAVIARPDPAAAQNGNPMLGGPHGVVKSANGDPLEGMMVQLIAKKTAIRTTVFSNADGRYEFPKLDAGSLHAAHRPAARIPSLCRAKRSRSTAPTRSTTSC